MCGRYYIGESEETSFWIDKTMQSSLVKEWQQLQEGTPPVPVSEHNRTVLLELHQAGVDYTGEVCDKDVHKLSDGVICNYCVAKKLET